MRVALIGGTGLVGRQIIPLLLARGHEVHALQRAGSADGHPSLAVHVAPAEAWAALVAGIKPQAAISTLGTTMRKAGSAAGFRAVDHDMVVAFASAAKAAGARRMVSVSAVGADAGSANFYLRIKGEVERALEACGYDRLDILRPGLLRGARGPDRRLGERIGIAISPLVNTVLRGRLSRFAAIDASVVAEAARACLRKDRGGIHRHENEALKRLAER